MSDSEEEVYSEEEVEEEVEEEEEEVVEDEPAEEEPETLAVPDEVYTRKSSKELDALMAKKLSEIGDVSTIEVDGSNLTEGDQELLHHNLSYRQELAEEIKEMKIKSERRKLERAEEEAAAAVARENELRKRKSEIEERNKLKEAEAAERRKKREEHMNQGALAVGGGAPNFVIQKREAGVLNAEMNGEAKPKQGGQLSKEAADAEKKSVLDQRIVPLELDGLSGDKLKAKAESLFQQVKVLVGQNYDFEKRYKERTTDMQELSERARSSKQTGASKLKRAKVAEGEVDPIADKFASAPAKIQMHSEHERRLDVRTYQEKYGVYHKPNMIPSLPPRIEAKKKIIFDEDTGVPAYLDMEGAA